ncbi:MAG: hypothetical protein MK105_02530 [Crocinitomicaceae bacterium]|nr:hypothetical protein [Crocinitomicaceae bacterium]
MVGRFGRTNKGEPKSNSESKNQNELTFQVDEIKRDSLVKKYDLLNFINPVFLTLDDFFDGNNDDASIAPNLDTKLKVE